MSDLTFPPADATAWRDFDLSAPAPDDVLRAAVTRSYWPGLPAVQAAPLAVLVPVLRRVEAAL